MAGHAKSIVVVDLPSICTQVINSGIRTDKSYLRDYFKTWFDFDFLMDSIAGDETIMGIWVFHSANAIGPGDANISGAHLEEYIQRINKLQGVTTCKSPVPRTNGQEKGVDVLLVTYLFKTLEHWDKAYILAHDGDFAPAVSALREKGKIVTGIGIEANVNKIMARECYSYKDIIEFLRSDIELYDLIVSENCFKNRLREEAEDIAESFGVEKIVSLGPDHRQIPFRINLREPLRAGIPNNIKELLPAEKVHRALDERRLTISITVSKQELAKIERHYPEGIEFE